MRILLELTEFLCQNEQNTQKIQGREDENISNGKNSSSQRQREKRRKNILIRFCKRF